MRKAATICLALTLCSFVPSYADEKSADRETEFATKVDNLRQRLDEKKIGELEYARSSQALIKEYMPNDYDLHTLSAYHVLLATQLKEKKISRAEYDYRWEERRNEVFAKRAQQQAARQAEIDAAEVRERLADQEAQRADAVRAERAREYAARMAAAEAEAERQRSVAANAMFLQSIGNAFRNAYPRPAVRCNSIPSGYVVSTTCY